MGDSKQASAYYQKQEAWDRTKKKDAGTGGLLSGALPYILLPMQIRHCLGTNHRMQLPLHPAPCTKVVLMQAGTAQVGWARNLGGVVPQNSGPQTGPRGGYIRQGRAAAGQRAVLWSASLEKLYTPAFPDLRTGHAGDSPAAGRSVWALW